MGCDFFFPRIFLFFVFFVVMGVLVFIVMSFDLLCVFFFFLVGFIVGVGCGYIGSIMKVIFTFYIT